MTEHPLFHGAPFPPEVISAMATVFDEVSRERGLAPPRKDPICELVARAIPDCAQSGRHDPKEIRLRIQRAGTQVTRITPCSGGRKRRTRTRGGEDWASAWRAT